MTNGEVEHVALRWRPTADDFIAGARVHMAYGRYYWRMQLQDTLSVFCWIVGFALAALVVGGVALNGHDAARITAIALAAVLGGAVGWRRTPLTTTSWERRVKRRYGHDPQLGAEAALQTGEGGVRIEAGDKRWDYTWSAMPAWGISDNALVFSVHRGTPEVQFHVVPMRAAATEADRQRLRSVFQVHLGPPHVDLG